MSGPDLTIVIPTQGRETLPRCLASMAADVQSGPRPEIIVVADTHAPPLIGVAALCRTFGVSYAEHDAGTHNWGYPQLQHGYEQAEGSYILNIGDDDVYEPGAFEAIRAAIRETSEGPLLFRALMHPSPSRPCRRPMLLWSERGQLVRGKVSGQNLATPNAPGRIGFWWDDFCHMETVVNAWGGLVHWREEQIARCY